MTSANAPSKIWLILGIVMIVLALVSGYAAMSGVSTLKSGGEALQQIDTSEGPATDIALTVPGMTSADLQAKSYAIALHGADIGEVSEDDFGEVNFDLPEVTWEISGPGSATVTHNVSARMNDVVRAGEFIISEPGTYEVVASLPAGATNEYTYSIEDDALAMIGEAAGALGQAAGGFAQVVLGGLCGSLFGILGVIFLIVHFVKGGKGKQAAEA